MQFRKVFTGLWLTLSLVPQAASAQVQPLGAVPQRSRRFIPANGQFGPQPGAPAGAPAAPSGPAHRDIVVKPSGEEGVDPINFEQRKKNAKFTFEFSKAEVIDVVKAISDMTRQNFIIPEKIKGQRVTILSPTRITSAEAYQVFYTALSANGISVVRSGKFLKLVDSKEAIKDTVPTCIDDDPSCALFHEQMVTLLLHLRHSDVGQVNTVVRSLLSRDGDVTIFQPSNAMIISEYSPNLKRVRRIIEALDVPGFNDELQLVQIQYSSAAEIAEKITQIFEVQARGASSMAPGRPAIAMPGMPQSVMGSQAQGADDGEVQISKIVPDDRTNQIIIKANKRSFEAIKKLIARLDVPISETEQGRVHVYYLENAKAEDLASTLSSLASGAPNTKSGKSASPGAPGLPPQARGGAPTEATTLFEGDVKVTADKATNSLLIMSSGHDYRALRSIIERLDKPRRQVYVEAAIMEVDLEDNESVGLNWHAPFPIKSLFGNPINDNTAFLQSAQNSSSPSPTFTALVNSTYLLQAAGGALAGIFGQPNAIKLGDSAPFQVPSFGLILKWLETTSNVNILSTPHLLTTDNEQAHIEVGQKVPFNTGLFGGLQSGLAGLGGAGAAGGAAGALGGLGGLGALGALGGGSIQRIDVSLKLTLTPQINEHNKIRLEIEQSVEDLSGEDASKSTPTTSHRSLKTVIIADDQQTVVLGGLMRDRSSDSETKIPFFGDLPILGYLFKQRNDKAQKVNLLLVLTPYIINSQADFQRIFERKIQEHDEFAAQYYGHRKEYRAHIDYSKKTGPLSRLVSTLRREREKYENGGEGDGSEVLVGPQKIKAAAAANPQKPAARQPGETTRLPTDDADQTHGQGPDAAPAAPTGVLPAVQPPAHDLGDTKVLPQAQPNAAGKSDMAPGADTFTTAPSVTEDPSSLHETKNGMPQDSGPAQGIEDTQGKEGAGNTQNTQDAQGLQDAQGTQDAQGALPQDSTFPAAPPTTQPNAATGAR
jgi:general secretion pathway protein D